MALADTEDRRGQWLADVARDCYGDAGATVVRNAVDTELFHAGPREEGQQPAVGLVYLSDRSKGCDVNLAGVRAAEKRLLGLRLVSFGRRQIDPQLPLPENAEYHVSPPQAELKKIYAGAMPGCLAAERKGSACRAPAIGTSAGAASDLLAKGGGDRPVRTGADRSRGRGAVSCDLGLPDRTLMMHRKCVFRFSSRQFTVFFPVVLTSRNADGSGQQLQSEFRSVHLEEVMSAFVPYVPLIWLVAVVAVFPSFGRPHRALLFIIFSGTLFLPEAMPDHIALGPFHFGKYHAISYAALLGALVYDSGRLLSGRLGWVDVPIVIWCLCPLPSVLTNDPPPDGSSVTRDAIAQVWTQTVTFGIPYLLGRRYFSDRAALWDLALAVVIAATVYVPLCLIEVRLSPQLHYWIYGYSQHDFAQTMRFGGYRPMVFLQHGLALGMFMTSACLIATWMWWSGAFGGVGRNRAGAGMGLSYLPLILASTTVLLKSMGAVSLGVVGATVLWFGRATGSRWWLLLLAAVPIVYVSVRVTGEWSGEALVQGIAENISEDRAASLQTRLKSENVLAQRALEQPTFGWSGWGRSLVIDDETHKMMAIPDGYWIIVFGTRGLVGLCALGGVLLVPVIRFAWLVPPTRWSDCTVAPAAACAVVLALWTIDSLLNAMALPVYFVISGSLAGADIDDCRLK